MKLNKMLALTSMVSFTLLMSKDQQPDKNQTIKPEDALVVAKITEASRPNIEFVNAPEEYKCIVDFSKQKEIKKIFEDGKQQCGTNSICKSLLTMAQTAIEEVEVNRDHASLQSLATVLYFQKAFDEKKIGEIIEKAKEEAQLSDYTSKIEMRSDGSTLSEENLQSRSLAAVIQAKNSKIMPFLHKISDQAQTNGLTARAGMNVHKEELTKKIVNSIEEYAKKPNPTAADAKRLKEEQEEHIRVFKKDVEQWIRAQLGLPKP